MDGHITRHIPLSAYEPPPQKKNNMLVVVNKCLAHDHAQDLHSSKYIYDGYLRIMFKTTIPEVGSTVASSSLADTADNGLFCGDFFHRKLRNGDFERDLSLLRSLTN